MFVDSNLLDHVLAFDAYFLVSNKMLYDDVCHILSVCIAISIQTMNSTEYKLVESYCSILASNGLWKHNR